MIAKLETTQQGPNTKFPHFHTQCEQQQTMNQEQHNHCLRPDSRRYILQWNLCSGAKIQLLNASTTVSQSVDVILLDILL